MAVDTRDKRSSVLGIASPLFPNPDGSLATAADRLHMGWCYSGIAVAAVTVPDVPGMEWQLSDHRMHYQTTDQKMHYQAEET